MARVARSGLWVLAVSSACVALGAARADQVASEGYVALYGAAATGAPASGPRHQPAAVVARELSMLGLVAPVFARDGRALVGGDAGVVALDTSGKLLWTQRIGSVTASPVALGDDRFLFTTRSGLWEVAAGGAVRAWPSRLHALSAPVALDSGGVAFVAHDGSVEVVDRSGEGVSRLPLELGPSARLSPLPGTRVAALDAGTRLLVASVADGLQLRVMSPERSQLGPLHSPGDDALWLFGEQGRVMRFDAGGHLTTDVKLVEQQPVAVAMAADGSLRVATQRNLVVCLAPDGTERWRVGLDGRVGEIVLDAEDTSFVVTRQGSLFAIDRGGMVRFRVGVAAFDGPRPVLAEDGSLWLATRRGGLQVWR